MIPEADKLRSWNDGSLYGAWELFGAHPAARGTAFTVWAPHASEVRVTGDFCRWTQGYPLYPAGGGAWYGEVPSAREGQLYKYCITAPDGRVLWKADPFAAAAELRPGTASRIRFPRHDWRDGEWMAARRTQQGPRNIYEVHAGSWRRKEDGSFLSWDELADELVPYVRDMGFTHLELLPVMEHPFDGSWGYQCTGYFAPTSRHGEPEGLMRLIDRCHREGVGVILDWVPGHFCPDEHGLAYFDGTPLYGSRDLPGWGTSRFDFGSGPVRSFLISSALYWLRAFHADGLRVDGVSSMLYLNYGVHDPALRRFNENGGEEDLDAIAFLRALNGAVGRLVPGTETYAEESSAWPLVTAPPENGGLGFHYKWDMGWMNDTLRFFSLDFPERPREERLLTFSMMYAFSENFILPLSHDEVVHGKRSLIGRMPGPWQQQFAGAKLLRLYAAAHPGGMLAFMGSEFAQFIEWRHDEGLEWFLLDYETHAGVQRFYRELNTLYRSERALWADERSWRGFQWIEPGSGDGILSFLRVAPEGDTLLCLLNFSPRKRAGRSTGVPFAGRWEELISSDDARFGGEGAVNPGPLYTRPVPRHGQPCSLRATIPPLGGTILKYMGEN